MTLYRVATLHTTTDVQGRDVLACHLFSKLQVLAHVIITQLQY